MNQPHLSLSEIQLLMAIQGGLPLTTHPYAVIGTRIGLSESEVLTILGELLRKKIIKRMGIVVRHLELGFIANAMVVWDVPEERIRTIGKQMSQYPFVNLCYRRRRSLPDWPFNLYCMIHGQERAAVMNKIALLQDECGLTGMPNKILFSTRRFKQRGAIYFKPESLPRSLPNAKGEVP